MGFNIEKELITLCFFWTFLANHVSNAGKLLNDNNLENLQLKSCWLSPF